MNDKIESRLGYTFKRHALLKHAITHPSFVHEHGIDSTESNARLEFLGDAVLQLVVSDYLYHIHPDMPEGELTKMRSGLVCELSLATVAKELKFGDFLLLGQGEVKEGGRAKDSILADAMEAIIGAMYLDGGIEETRNIIERLFMSNTDKLLRQAQDFKSTLQEYLQKKRNGYCHLCNYFRGRASSPAYIFCRSVL
jgi:ribonuclease-3